ncbi:MAG: YjbH domain-containing protein [Alphaproteobacteria bacterium]|nr:YjbH domain-containing protein [Alphaproteobacteria bacterium]
MPLSSALSGPIGLNIVPSARTDEAGTISAGISTLDPYVHAFLGVQIAAPLYINIRQSAEASNINEGADRLYPGVDVKLRLISETRSRPEMALGVNSALGHKRMAAEYLTLSKRWKDFDFTLGAGWGRMGSAGHLDNPLKSLLSHFGKRRGLDGEMPNEPGDWFTGDDIGLFGGVEYFTSVSGLSLKADWNADAYQAERNSFGFSAPAPWSAGLSYAPLPWINLGLAAQGTEKIMGRLSVRSNIRDWRDQVRPVVHETPLRPYRTGLTLPTRMDLSAASEGIVLYDPTADSRRAEAKLVLTPYSPAPLQIGRAAIHMANHAGRSIEELSITPTVMGLKGPAVHLLRGDLERALVKKQGSPEEIWRHARFEPQPPAPLKKLKRPGEVEFGLSAFSFVLDNQVSLAEEDSGVLYRTSVVAGVRGPAFFGFMDSGMSLCVNARDNLHRLRDIRPASPLPVRSDVDRFAARTVGLENSWLALSHSFGGDVHGALAAGYLEEMFGGLGGEVLYRPFGSRFAWGLESWQAFKRDPETPLNLGFNGDHILTAHAKAWYDLPRWDMTLQGKFGRYLAGDVGGTVSLLKNFRNGAALEGFVTLTNYADFDLFGGTTHADHGLRLTLPLGGYKHMPPGAAVRVRAAPFGRDIGQAVESPVPLYALTEPLSYPHMAQQWGRVVE